MAREISVLIICGDRLAEVTRCLASLELLGDSLCDVQLLKNAPKNPWPEDAFARLPASVTQRLNVYESLAQVFPTTGRNQLAEKAGGSVYLFLDDDSLVLNGEGILKGLSILQSDPKVGSIAYPQSTEKGELGPYAQPAPRDHACLTCGFMTCAALVRADVYHQLGGFQELLQMAHEENEFCKRQWDLGYSVVYLPDTCICHNPSPNARNSRQRAKLNARNGWYQAVLHEPLPMLAVSLVPRVVQSARYLRHAGEWTDGNWFPLLTEGLRNLVTDLPALLKARRPLQWSSLRRWQQIKQSYPAYPQHA